MGTEVLMGRRRARMDENRSRQHSTGWTRSFWAGSVCEESPADTYLVPSVLGTSGNGISQPEPGTPPMGCVSHLKNNDAWLAKQHWLLGGAPEINV